MSAAKNLSLLAGQTEMPFVRGKHGMQVPAFRRGKHGMLYPNQSTAARANAIKFPQSPVAGPGPRTGNPPPSQNPVNKQA